MRSSRKKRLNVPLGHDAAITMLKHPPLKYCGLCPRGMPDPNICCTIQQERGEAASIWTKYMMGESYEFSQIPRGNYVDTGGISRLCIYPDGSCEMPDNTKGRLRSTSQHSYRAELTGVHRITRHLRRDVLIRPDCKSIADDVEAALGARAPSQLTIDKAPVLWEL